MEGSVAPVRSVRHKPRRKRRDDRFAYVVAVLGLSQMLVETLGGESIRYVYGPGTLWVLLAAVTAVGDVTVDVVESDGRWRVGYPVEEKPYIAASILTFRLASSTTKRRNVPSK